MGDQSLFYEKPPSNDHDFSLFILQKPLLRDHLSYKTTFTWRNGWSLKIVFTVYMV
jgi:hypothetical protein